MKLIVGLGNPGKQYCKTRHNVGFMVLDALQKNREPIEWSAWEVSKKFNAEVATGTYHGTKIIALKPLTFMNESGMAVQLAMNFYKIKLAEVIVVHDDKDIPLGEIKIQTDRGHAGHNGVRSIIDHAGTQNFTRLRVGVAASNSKKMADMADFVLSKFGLLERRTLEKVITATLEKILTMI